MVKKFAPIWTLLLTFFASESAAFAESFVYSIYNHPATDRGVSCAQRASEYASRFASVHGVRVAGALCEYDDLVESHKIYIRYDSLVELPLVSTYTFSATYDAKGTYATEEDCLAAIPREENIFESETGLDVFLSFCSRQRLERKQPWYVHIDGFGATDRIPGRMSWTSDRPLDITEAELKSVVQRHFAPRGVNVRHFVMRPGALQGGATVFYYAPVEDEPLQMSGNRVVTVPGLAACRAQAEEMKQQMIGNDKISLVATYCTSPYSNPTSFEITLAYEGYTYIDTVESSTGFRSMQECLAHQQSIRNNMAIVHGDKLLAAVCGLPRYSGGGSQQQFRVIGLKVFR